MVGAWPMDKLTAVLANRVAMAQVSGRPTPVAARVLRHLLEQRAA